MYSISRLRGEYSARQDLKKYTGIPQSGLTNPVSVTTNRQFQVKEPSDINEWSSITPHH